MNIYDFKVKDNQGNDQKIEKYKGKVLLIVNTATECGFTPQYADLQKLYDTYKGKGLEILDFPCDQFGHQAPGTDQEIAKFCTARFGITFPQFAKLEVNGKNQNALFSYLKEKQSFKGFNTSSIKGRFMHEILSRMDADYAKKSDIKWNFTKFLIDRKGNVIGRFEPTESLSDVENAITSLL